MVFNKIYEHQPTIFVSKNDSEKVNIIQNKLQNYNLFSMNKQNSLKNSLNFFGKFHMKHFLLILSDYIQIILYTNLIKTLVSVF